MSEKEIRQLLKLLAKFATVKENDGTMLNSRETSILYAVRQWVAWYGRDELSMDP